MRRHTKTVRREAIAMSILLSCLLAPSAFAEELDTVLDAGDRKAQEARDSQGRIDAIVESTRDLESQHRQVLKEIEGLRVYNEYMERQLEGQAGELAELRKSIDRVSDVERQMMPLMIRMLEGLEKFVRLDVPFLPEERSERVAGLGRLMERSDVSAAEKFRRLVEAFQIENDFGRSIESYRDTLTLSGSTLEVTMLRIGRIGLYFQTNDASITGMWNRESRDWMLLEDERSRHQVRQGLKIAGKQIAPDLLLLPIETPEDAS